MKKLATAAIVAASIASTHVSAQDLSITVTNLTHGLVFTPVFDRLMCRLWLLVIR